MTYELSEWSLAVLSRQREILMRAGNFVTTLEKA